MNNFLSKKSVSAPFVIALIAISSISIVSTIDASSVPGWIKNNAQWWSEGSISEGEYLKSLEYLITNGVIQVPTPITEANAASTSLTDEERAQSFVVHFYGGVFPKKSSITTFSKYSVTSGRENPNNAFYSAYKFGEKIEFMLESLPSKDKMPAYNTINSWINRDPTKTKEFNVDIDVVAGDGTILQRISYGQCILTGYGTYLQEIINLYSFSGKDQAEIRDRWLFSCSHVEISAPKK
jgi:hypothetical protein